MSRKRTEQERERQREFGRRIQQLREEQGLTQGDVTRMSGMDRSFISNLETGVYSIAAARLDDLAQGLRIDTVDLFEEEHAVRNKDEVGSMPRYMELVDFVSKEIASGLLRPGDFLPHEIAMCQRYGYSRSAVQKALAVLRGRGLIRSWGDQHFVGSSDDLKPISVADGDRVVARMPTPTEMFHSATPEGVPVFIRRRRDTTNDEIFPADRFYIEATTSTAVSSSTDVPVGTSHAVMDSRGDPGTQVSPGAGAVS